MRVAVVGGMNLDLLGLPAGPLLPRDSNPGRVILRPGGVGRNIAARLATMGVTVSLITALGQDEWAKILSDACAQAGIDLRLSVKTALPSPCYLCIHDDKGDMAAAINDMTAMEALTPDALLSRLPAINQADGCVLDANLPAGSLLLLAQNARVPLLLDPVSCAKAPRVSAILPYLALIKPNQMEARALTGESDPEKAAEKLLKAGVRRVLISLGNRGVYYADGAERGLMPARPLPALPLTGAGDALCAGAMRALLMGKSTREIAVMGRDAAYEALLAASAGNR